MSSKVKFKWTKIKQDAFDEINRIAARDNLFTNLDFNEEFKIRTNIIDFQLGAVIIHKVKTINFYNRRLTDAQKSYTLTER